MRNVIFGAIGVLFGGAVLVASFVRGEGIASGSYGAGQMAGLVFAVLLLGVGAFYLIQGLRNLGREEPEERPRKRKRRPRDDDDE